MPYSKRGWHDHGTSDYNDKPELPYPQLKCYLDLNPPQTILLGCGFPNITTLYIIFVFAFSSRLKLFGRRQKPQAFLSCHHAQTYTLTLSHFVWETQHPFPKTRLSRKSNLTFFAIIIQTRVCRWEIGNWYKSYKGHIFFVFTENKGRGKSTLYTFISAHTNTHGASEFLFFPNRQCVCKREKVSDISNSFKYALFLEYSKKSLILTVFQLVKLALHTTAITFW